MGVPVSVCGGPTNTNETCHRTGLCGHPEQIIPFPGRIQPHSLRSGNKLFQPPVEPGFMSLASKILLPGRERFALLLFRRRK